jgi:hypothetical protein
MKKTGRSKRNRFDAEEYARLVASIPRWPQADMPSWVPAGARKYLLWRERILRIKQSSDSEPPQELVIVQRLASAPKMRYVWKELQRRGASDDALWMFASSACHEALNPGIVVTTKERDKGAEQFANVATICRNMIDQDNRVRNHPKLAAAFALVADHFELWAQETKLLKSPHLVKHRTKDNEARNYVLALGKTTHDLFGNTLYSTVATVASIALGRKVDPARVRYWCAGSDRSTPAILGPGK